MLCTIWYQSYVPRYAKLCTDPLVANKQQSKCCLNWVVHQVVIPYSLYMHLGESVVPWPMRSVMIY